MHKIGLHVRYQDSLRELIDKSQRLGLPFIQFFLTRKQAGKPLLLSDEIIKQFLPQTKKLGHLVVHASYWADLSSGNKFARQIGEKEYQWAQAMGASYFVLHGGSAKRFADKKRGIKLLAEGLNWLLNQSENGPQLVLENTAFGNFYVGSAIEDFACLQNYLDGSRPVKFCLDTAHAYAYGYDLSSWDKMASFLLQFDELIGLEKIALIHLNNTAESCGSHYDKHSLLDQGNIPEKVLAQLICHPRLSDVPLILELPIIEEEMERKQLEKVLLWKKKEEKI